MNLLHLILVSSMSLYVVNAQSTGKAINAISSSRYPLASQFYKEKLKARNPSSKQPDESYGSNQISEPLEPVTQSQGVGAQESNGAPAESTDYSKTVSSYDPVNGYQYAAQPSPSNREDTPGQKSSYIIPYQYTGLSSGEASYQGGPSSAAYGYGLYDDGKDGGGGAYQQSLYEQGAAYSSQPNEYPDSSLYSSITSGQNDYYHDSNLQNAYGIGSYSGSSQHNSYQDTAYADPSQYQSSYYGSSSPNEIDPSVYSKPSLQSAYHDSSHSDTYSGVEELISQNIDFAEATGEDPDLYVTDESSSSDENDDDSLFDISKPSKPDTPPIITDNNPLNFLNLVGTDFQPGRLVNIFFGLFIMLFMIILHGYALWILGIAYLPGTRALNDWALNKDKLEGVCGLVLDAIEYWENRID